jgi:hypothetical protein
MSDRQNDVLAAIDGALDDWTVSGDAMRWQPPGTERELPKRPVDRNTMGRSSYHNPLAGSDLPGDRTVTVRLNISIRPLVEAARRAEESVRQLEAALARVPASAREWNSHLAMAGEAVDLFRRYYPDRGEVREELTGDDFRIRALEHQQNRGAGPKPSRRIPPRDLRR